MCTQTVKKETAASATVKKEVPLNKKTKAELIDIIDKNSEIEIKSQEKLKELKATITNLETRIHDLKVHIKNNAKREEALQSRYELQTIDCKNLKEKITNVLNTIEAQNDSLTRFKVTTFIFAFLFIIESIFFILYY